MQPLAVVENRGQSALSLNGTLTHALYQAMYTRNAQHDYGAYSAGAASHAEYQKLQEWRRQIIAGKRHDVVKYTQAVRAYEKSNGGG